MPVSHRHLLDAGFAFRPLAEVLDASPAALAGVSAADAQRLRDAFGIRTLRDLATNRFFEAARALLAASGVPAFDPGPPRAWEDFFATAPTAFYREHPSRRFRIEFGPVWYRGRLDGSARVLVVGQDPSTDEILAQRGFVGHSGQRVQGLLRKLGITRSYVMCNAFLFPIHGQYDTTMRGISSDPTVRGWREEYLERLANVNRFEAVLAIGTGAREAIAMWPRRAEFEVFELMHPSAPESAVLADWNGDLAAMIAALQPDEDGVADPTPYGATFAAGQIVEIPRFDLPFGIPPWHGSGSTRSARDGDRRIVWSAP